MSWMTGYLGEIRSNWRALLAASLGLVAGTISNYINNLFSPHLIAEFHWAKSQFALTGLVVVIAVVFLPVAGRIADRVGTRRIATTGVVGLPVVFAALSMMDGSFTVFMLLSLAQMLIVSCLAGIVVYTRIIAATFDKARGIALGLISCVPALAAMLGSPLLSALIAQHGWRAGYQAMSLFTAVVGGLALALIPAAGDRPAAPTSASAVANYPAVFRSTAFYIIFAALLLCNVHFTIQTTQLQMVALERGVSAGAAGFVVSLFAIGVILGRVLCGLALDRFAAHRVAAVFFAIPSAGLAMLAAHLPGDLVVGAGVLALGLSLGAEGDLVAFLAMRYFPGNLFSSVLGLFTAAMAVSALLGALLLSFTLGRTGGYSLFLGIAAATMFAGSLGFLLLARQPVLSDAGAAAGGHL